jgi:hypothetical protein
MSFRVGGSFSKNVPKTDRDSRINTSFYVKRRWEIRPPNQINHPMEKSCALIFRPDVINQQRKRSKQRKQR